MADDLSVINAARVSFAKRSEGVMHVETLPHGTVTTWTLVDDDKGLIRYLLTNRHGTPFEHNAFRFHVKCPIFVAREWMRHRIGSFNEMSGRYTKLDAEFYVPENVRSQVGKPGAYTFDPVSDELADFARTEMQFINKGAWGIYELLLDKGIAKEIARMVLPVNIYTQFYWTVNARSLMNFLSLRNADTAMFEIRQYADVIETIFAGKMPVTYEAFVANSRVAP